MGFIKSLSALFVLIVRKLLGKEGKLTLRQRILYIIALILLLVAVAIFILTALGVLIYIIR